MKKLILLMSVILTLTWSCSKDEPEKFPCEIEQFGTLKVKNISCCAIKVYVNGKFTIVLARDQEELIPKVPIGNARVQAYQDAQGLEWDNNIRIIMCEISAFTFRE